MSGEPGGDRDRQQRETPDALEALLAAALARIEDEGLAAVDALCLEQPQHASWLRRQLEALRGFGMLPVPDESPSDTADFPERLGEFRLLRRLGSGGMGVVYLAEQEALKRKVALKLVRPDQMYFPKARERFRREIETIARLEHPGIVRIYAVGEERGIPYFAMEWIDGVTLAELLKELRSARPETLTGRDLVDAVRRRAQSPASGVDAPHPDTLEESWTRTCLLLVRRVAEALHHAHELGILHRDVKPGNVMVTASGRVVLLDFGLAASIEGSRVETRITQSGSQLGSLPYMAPEQHRGERTAVSARTDVYALGVLLYELLTHRLPFEADDVEALRAQVLAGEFVPPRRRNANVDWDVETICLKAMELDPARRYGSALALARDLENALTLRPIEARRASALARLRREVRRRPARAVALLLGGLLVLVVPTVWSLFSRRDAERERAAVRRIGAQQELAERNLSRALNAVERMLTSVATQLENEPRTESLRRELLEEAVELLESMRRDYSGRVGVLSPAAGAWLKVAQLHRSLGDYDASLAALQHTGEALATAETAAPAREDLRLRRLDLAFGLAEDLLERGRLEDVQRLVDESRALLPAEGGEALVDRFAGLLVQATFAWSRLGDGERAQANAQEAVDRLEKLKGDRLHLAEAWFALGDARMCGDELEGARDAFGEARTRYEARLAAGTAKLATLQNLVMTLGELGLTLHRMGEYPMAEEVLTEGIARSKEILDALPQAINPRTVLAALHCDLGATLEELEKFEDAERAMRRSVDGIRDLAKSHLDQRTLQRDHATHVQQLAEFLSARARDAESLPFYEEAERVLSTLIERFPDDVDALGELANGQHRWALALARLAREDEALAHLERAFDRMCEAAARALPASTGPRLRSIAESYTGMLEGKGRSETAAAVRQRVEQLLASNR